MGLGVETAALAHLVEDIRHTGETCVGAELVETDRNLPCRDVYARSGFDREGDGWICPASRAPETPSHVTMRHAEPVAS